MASGDHDFTAGEILTAGNVDDYLMLQSLQKYAAAANRDSALTTRKREGMATIQDDTNCITVYSGAAWSSIGPVHGALTTWSPTLTQNVTPTFSITAARYTRQGRWIQGYTELLLTAGTSGTAANGVIMGLPVAHGLTTNQVIGAGMIFDQSAGTKHRFMLVAGATAVTARGYPTAFTTDIFEGAGDFSAALTTSDFVSYQFAYEASGDA